VAALCVACLLLGAARADSSTPSASAAGLSEQEAAELRRFDRGVIWGDYHPEGQLESESDFLHGGGGSDWIHSSHGYTRSGPARVTITWRSSTVTVPSSATAPA
jgi:hypothetical protein